MKLPQDYARFGQSLLWGSVLPTRITKFGGPCKTLFMHRSLLIAIALVVPFAVNRIQAQSSAPAQFALLPLPASMTVADGAFPLTSTFSVATTGVDSPRLDGAIGRMLNRVSDETGLQLSKQIEHGTHAGVVVDVRSKDAEVQGIDEDESYSLTVSPSSVHLEAATSTGAMRGLETLLQLVQVQKGSFVIPAVEIKDAPRFRWRGLMIDCSRHFEPIDVLKRNIDAMAAVKLNVFHWHLMDDQGVRIESKRFPKLTELGSDGKFYTQEQARELVAYARARGIRVVPEFEMPGHSTAWLVAYPELNSGTQPSGIRRQFGVSGYALDPTRETTYTFISEFLQEMTTVFPDQYVHIGGDETPAPDWKKNPRILAFMRAHQLKDNAALQAYFNRRVLDILTHLNRRMVGWDEIFNPALPKSVVIQSWRGVASLAKSAEQGYEGVLSAPYYLDGMKPAETHYLADPIPADTTLTPEQQKLILGGEICMWGEHLDERTIDSRIWPRSAAIAERLWSPQDVRNVDDMYRRLEPVSVELESLGLKHLTSEDVGLRSLAGSENIGALRVFASAFEPVSFSERSSTQHTSQLTPLTGFVDAVRPDPTIRYEVEHAATILAQSPQAHSPDVDQARALLSEFFSRTGASVPNVDKIMNSSPRLALVRVRAEQLSQLAAIGNEALKYLQQGNAPAGWKSASLETIASARKPSALVRFHFLDSLTVLVNATQ